MTALEVAVGLTQMTLLMLATGVIARFVRTRAPELAATVGFLGLAASTAVVALTLLDVPRPIAARLEAADTNLTEHAVVAQQPSAPSESPPESTPRSSAEGISLQRMLRWLGEQSIAEDQPQAGTVGSTQTYWFAALLILVLMTPIALGLIETVRLHRRTVRCEEAEALRRHLPRDLAPIVQFRSADAVEAPCVTLFGGATIYLPSDWQSWSTGEIAAAVAHESAHLQRRDPFWRLLVELSAAMQILHPLAGWLRRGVLLSQEMAADRDAAGIQGRRYTHSLSRIALRLDAAATRANHHTSLKHCFVRPGIVSVSPSHLIRRIEMLTKHPKGCVSRKFRKGAIASVIASSALLMCWSVQADPPDDGTGGKSPEAHIASLPKYEGPQPFSHKQLTPWDDVQPSDTGFFAVRVFTVLEHDLFGPMAPVLVDPNLDMAWKLIATDDASDKRDALGLKLKNIRQVTGTMNFSLTKKESTDGSDHKSSIMFGSKGAKVWFNEPVSHDDIRDSLDIEKIAAFFESQGSPEDIGDLTYPEFVDKIVSPMFTDGAHNSELLIPPPKEDAAEYDEAQFAQLKKAWSAADGGMVTFAYSLPESLGYIENKEDELTDQLLKHAACMSIGLDFDSMNPAFVTVAFVPRDGVEPSELEDVLKTVASEGGKMLDEAIAEAKEGDETPEKLLELAELKQALGLFESHRIQVAASSEGQENDCVLVTLRVPLAAFPMLGMF